MTASGPCPAAQAPGRPAGGWPRATRIVLTAALLLPVPAAAVEGPLPDLWGNDGSIVRIIWTGNALLARTLIPGEDRHAARTRRGQRLFIGRMEWRTARIRGTAYLPRAGCAGGVPYAVSGRMTRVPEGLHRIRLRGPAPVAFSGCRATSLARTPPSDLLFLEWTE